MLRVARSRKRRSIRGKDGRGACRSVSWGGSGCGGVRGLGEGTASGECGENVESFCSRGRSA
jgi:hypothetical protein